MFQNRIHIFLLFYSIMSFDRNFPLVFFRLVLQVSQMFHIGDPENVRSFVFPVVHMNAFHMGFVLLFLRPFFNGRVELTGIIHWWLQSSGQVPVFVVENSPIIFMVISGDPFVPGLLVNHVNPNGFAIRLFGYFTPVCLEHIIQRILDTQFVSHPRYNFQRVFRGFLTLPFSVDEHITVVVVSGGHVNLTMSIPGVFFCSCFLLVFVGVVLLVGLLLRVGILY
uniref:Uncharacterized protein n=1 Tax=Cacopsylla melanoneura TaxID=428564 RepID=A0A8D8WWG5_9HEMI